MEPQADGLECGLDCKPNANVIAYAQAYAKQVILLPDLLAPEKGSSRKGRSLTQLYGVV